MINDLSFIIIIKKRYTYYYNYIEIYDINLNYYRFSTIKDNMK